MSSKLITVKTHEPAGTLETPNANPITVPLPCEILKSAADPPETSVILNPDTSNWKPDMSLVELYKISTLPDEA